MHFARVSGATLYLTCKGHILLSARVVHVVQSINTAAIHMSIPRMAAMSTMLLVCDGVVIAVISRTRNIAAVHAIIPFIAETKSVIAVTLV